MGIQQNLNQQNFIAERTFCDGLTLTGGDVPNTRVTRFKLDKKETVASVYKQGGAETTKGVICRA